MKNIKLRFILLFLVIGIPLLFTACLDPINTLPDLEFNIKGDIDFTDITAAVLLLTNRSMTVNVEEVRITQPEWTADDFRNVPIFETSFRGMPRALQRRAVYLNPSPHRYQVEVFYSLSGAEDDPAIIRKFPPFDILLTGPQHMIEYYIYRGADGKVVIISTVLEDPDPGDTGNALDDPLHGEGSSPAVIPPANRNRMATFIVVNRTGSQHIKSVDFKMGIRNYSMGNNRPFEPFSSSNNHLTGIRSRDQRSIALGQGDWSVRAHYVVNGNDRFTEALTASIVPSNDPWAINHVMYFYRDERGTFRLSNEWPPAVGGVLPDDLLPPDEGAGRGALKITNNTRALIHSVHVWNLKDDQYEPLLLRYEDHFSPSVPIQFNKTGYVDVVGLPPAGAFPGFPIDAHGDYLIQVQLDAIDGISVYETKAFIKDTVVEIVLNPEDINIVTAAGATVKMVNQTDAARWDVQIIGLTVRNTSRLEQSSSFDFGSFRPVGAIGNKPAGGNEASVLVLSSVNMPIRDSDRFKGELFILVNNRLYQVEAKFLLSPMGGEFPNLHSNGNPQDNIRYLLVTDEDIEGLMEPCDQCGEYGDNCTCDDKTLPPPAGGIYPNMLAVRIHYQGNTARRLRSVVFVQEPVNVIAGTGTGVTRIAGDISLTPEIINSTGKTGIPFIDRWEHHEQGTGSHTFERNILLSSLNGGGVRVSLEDLLKRNSDDRTAYQIAWGYGSLAIQEGEYRDVFLPLPPDGYGYTVYFYMSTDNHIMGYSGTGSHAPPINLHLWRKFWMNPRFLIDNNQAVWMASDSMTVLLNQNGDEGVFRIPVWVDNGRWEWPNPGDQVRLHGQDFGFHP